MIASNYLILYTSETITSLIVTILDKFGQDNNDFSLDFILHCVYTVYKVYIQYKQVMF